MRHIPSARRRCGFTLLEVLVALAILAIAMAALIRVASDSARTQLILQERTLAGWVAENVIAELQLEGRWPDAGSRFNGEAVMADRDWRWTVEVQATPEPDLRRVDVHVHAIGEDTAAAQLTAFLGRNR